MKLCLIKSLSCIQGVQEQIDQTGCPNCVFFQMSVLRHRFETIQTLAYTTSRTMVNSVVQSMAEEVSIRIILLYTVFPVATPLSWRVFGPKKCTCVGFQVRLFLIVFSTRVHRIWIWFVVRQEQMNPLPRMCTRISYVGQFSNSQFFHDEECATSSGSPAPKNLLAQCHRKKKRQQGFRDFQISTLR